MYIYIYAYIYTYIYIYIYTLSVQYHVCMCGSHVICMSIVWISQVLSTNIYVELNDSI